MPHQRREIDRRSVRVKLTEKGRKVERIVTELFSRQAEGPEARAVLNQNGIEEINVALRRVERYWADQIRYIY